MYPNGNIIGLNQRNFLKEKFTLFRGRLPPNIYLERKNWDNILPRKVFEVFRGSPTVDILWDSR